MAMSESGVPLRDEATIRWSGLEREHDPCLVVSDRMELVYINAAARELVPGSWFGKRCFEVLPNVDESCALHCPKIRAVNEAVEIVYCEEMIGSGESSARSFGVALIPLEATRADRARAVLVLRPKGGDEETFRKSLLSDATRLAQRVAAAVRS
jgi:hypothetical protein